MADAPNTPPPPPTAPLPPQPSAALVDADGRVALDAPCTNCRYNLRTLPVTGRCPECGQPVADSAASERLRNADARFVRCLARGAYVLAFAAITVAMSFAVALLALLASTGQNEAAGLTAICVIATVPPALLGVAFIAARDARASRQSERRRSRKRYLARLFVLTGLSLLGAQLLGVLDQTVSEMGAALVLIAALMFPAAILQYVAVLVQCSDRPQLKAGVNAATVVWLLGCAVTLPACLYSDRLPSFTKNFLLPIALAVVVVMLFSFGFTMCLAGRAFSAAGREAEAHAAQQQAEATTQPPPADQPGAGA